MGEDSKGMAGVTLTALDALAEKVEQGEALSTTMWR